MHRITSILCIALILLATSCNPDNREAIRHLNTGFMGYGAELMNNAVYAFARDGDWIWIGYGFLGAGVTKYNIKTGESRHFGNFIQENGVTYSMGGITHIMVTENHVWLAGGGSVYCLDRKTNRMIRSYYEGHGLPVSGIMCMSKIDGKVYVGLIRYGFTVIDDNDLDDIHSVQLPRTPDLMANPNEFHTVESISKLKGALFLSLSNEGIYLFKEPDKLKLLRDTKEFVLAKLNRMGKSVFLVLVPMGEAPYVIEEYRKGDFVRRRDLDFLLGKSQEVSSFFYDWNNRLWIAMSRLGICSFDENSHTVRIVSDNDILVDRHKFIYGFYFDGEYFWIGTPNDGAVMIPKNIMMEHVDKAKPIPIPKKYWNNRPNDRH